jgi:hypothetical protein
MNDLITHKEHALSWINKKYSALKKWLEPSSPISLTACSQKGKGNLSKKRGKRKTEKSLAAKCTKKMAEALKFQFP